MPKYYSFNGLDGCFSIHKNRKTGPQVGIYSGPQSGMECDQKWVTVCEEHGNLVSHDSLSSAKYFAARPDWCEECQKIMIKKEGI